MTKREKVNGGLKACVVNHFLCGDCPYSDLESSEFPIRCLHALLEDIASFDVPMPVKHVHEEYDEHDWILNDNGEIDTFAWDDDWCNGPCCARCGYHICEHCNPDWEEVIKSQRCIIDKYYCPICNQEVHRFQDNKCPNCNQELSWMGVIK